ncbi:MAG: copper amine oxidase N-terminal domain-containing protein [Defluviitaleaceae bacterium]|nr:copper amine oxidase N-terminal domain-containing protein [Defluviitaleaceae bacterium]MCL2263131.1 copper amine oxidase N-terminal domain-containing protein [Defluviitaleaceae bacterium]
MKKFVQAVAFMVFFAIFATPYVAAASADINLIINGERAVFPQPPVIVDGTTLVPVRGVFETLGYQVEWLPAERSARITNSRNEILATVGSNTFYTNGTAHNLNIPAQIINGSTMLPFRALLESVNYAVDWDSETRTIIITTGETTTPPQPTTRDLMPNMTSATTTATAVQGAAGLPIGAEISVLETETHLFAEILIPQYRTHTNILPLYPVFIESIVANYGDKITFDVRAGAGNPFFGFSTFRFNDMACQSTWGQTMGQSIEARHMYDSFTFMLDYPAFLHLSTSTMQIVDDTADTWVFGGDSVTTYLRAYVVIERAR